MPSTIVQAHVKEKGGLVGADEVGDTCFTGQALTGGVPIYEREDGEAFDCANVLKSGVAGCRPVPVGAAPTKVEAERQSSGSGQGQAAQSEDHHSYDFHHTISFLLCFDRPDSSSSNPL